MIQVFTFCALPSLRGLAASNPIDRQVRLPTARVELQSIVAADPNVRAASIVDMSGQVIYATDSTVNEIWSERVFVQQALRGQLHASVPVREFGEVSQYYSAPLLNNAREVAGAVVLRIAVQDMWAALDNQSDMWLVDENGVRIADTSAKPQTFVALEPLNANTMSTIYRTKLYGPEITQIRSTNFPDLAVAVRRRSTPVTWQDAQGQVIHAAMERLKTNSWTVIAFASEDSIFAAVNDALVLQILIALVSAIVAACAVLWGRSISSSNEKDG
ncbi:MAG: cache domain-containing protein [Chloroflexi bacterium]|nr:cache domain-containing protein [Chloroflexota bacterium]